MTNLFEVVPVIYLVIGILLATIGPAGKDITVEVDRIRGSSLLDAYLEREPPSELKLWIFRVIITAGFVLLWPVFIFGIMKAQRKAKEEDQSFDDKRSQGLWFHYLGGYGSIICKDCTHSESLTSFTHGRKSRGYFGHRILVKCRGTHARHRRSGIDPFKGLLRCG